MGARPRPRTSAARPAAYLRWLASTGIVAAPDDLRATLEAHAAAGVTHAALVLPSRVPPEAWTRWPRRSCAPPA